MTDNITLPRKTVEQALEALKAAAPCHNLGGPLRQSLDTAITAMREALGAPDQGDSYDEIWNALQRVDTAAVFLPTFSVKHEGGIAAVTQNIVDAIVSASEALAAPDVPEGWKLVPMEPTAQQWGGLARDLIMWVNHAGEKTPRALLVHLENLGRDIPQWLLDEPEMKALDHDMSKGMQAVLIYRAMLGDAPDKLRRRRAW